MKLEDQVCSLELAKKLKELGVKQEGLFSWYYLGLSDAEFAICPAEDIQFPVASAFTVAELGEMLPKGLQTDDGPARLLGGFREQWACAYGTFHRPFDFYIQYADTEADARAKMLIYLLEQKLITL